MATSGFVQARGQSTLTAIFGGTAFTKPAAVYIGLDSATGTDPTGSFTELSGNAYARVVISATNVNVSNAVWDNGSGAAPTTNDTTGEWQENVAVLTFPTATPSGWTAATGFRLWDSGPGAGGLGIMWGTFGSPTTVGAGATASFAAHALKITIF